MREPISESECYGGVQKLYRFANNYGASVVRHAYSYGSESGLWELAVLKYDGVKSSIVYDTPVTSDVEGFLTEEKVDALLEQIEALQ